MYSILLVVERPPATSPEHRDHDKHDRYDSAIKGISELANTNKRFQALGENVLLIPIDDTLDVLSDAICVIRPADYQYAILTEDASLQKLEASLMKA